MSRRQIVLVVLAPVQMVWIFLIGSQTNPWVLGATLLVLIHTTVWISRELLRRRGAVGRLLMGAVVGYVAAVAAVAISELSTRGLGLLARDFTPNLYFFPFVSGGWLYGSIWALVSNPAANPTAPEIRH